MNVALWWKKEYDEPWGLMTTHQNLTTAIESYGKRFSIEPMHKDWKTNAFDIEGTRVTDAKRIETLLIPIALCYILCMLEGDRKEEQGEVIHAHRHKRTTGLFLVGLSAFCRILRATQLSRLLAFFQRTFTGWLWPERLAQLSKTKSVSYFGLWTNSWSFRDFEVNQRWHQKHTTSESLWIMASHREGVGQLFGSLSESLIFSN